MNHLKIISILLLIVFVSLFVHSEILENCHSDDSHSQYDYCNLITNVNLQQNDTQKVYFDIYALPSIHCVKINENAISEITTVSNTPVKNISRVILFDTFII